MPRRVASSRISSLVIVRLYIIAESIWPGSNRFGVVSVLMAPSAIEAVELHRMELTVPSVTFVVDRSLPSTYNLKMFG